jgi:hypothetical protein
MLPVIGRSRGPARARSHRNTVSTQRGEYDDLSGSCRVEWGVGPTVNASKLKNPAIACTVSGVFCVWTVVRKLNCGAEE